MPYVDIVTALALLQLVWFGMQVAQARGKYGVQAPGRDRQRYFRAAFSGAAKHPGAAHRFPSRDLSLQPLFQSDLGGGAGRRVPARTSDLFHELRQRSELAQRGLRAQLPARRDSGRRRPDRRRAAPRRPLTAGSALRPALIWPAERLQYLYQYLLGWPRGPETPAVSFDEGRAPANPLNLIRLVPAEGAWESNLGLGLFHSSPRRSSRSPFLGVFRSGRRGRTPTGSELARNRRHRHSAQRDRPAGARERHGPGSSKRCARRVARISRMCLG